MNIDLGGFVPDDEDDRRFRRAKREFWRKARRLAGFPGLKEARALFRLMCDRTQPWRWRALAAAAILYLVIPLDCCPDCLPGGLVDDVAAIAAVVLILFGVVDAYFDGDQV